jgi:kynurenine 3-monooxygenase
MATASFALAPSTVSGLRYICNPKLEPARETCHAYVGRACPKVRVASLGGSVRMAAERRNIAVVGGGPVGCMAATALARMNENHVVTIFDRAADPGLKLASPAPKPTSNFPNVNMSVSLRGVRALESLGVQVTGNPGVFAPVAARLLHRKRSKPVAARGIEAKLHSVSRADLDTVCLNSAKESGVVVQYGCVLERLGTNDHTATFVKSAGNGEPESTISVKYDMLIGCDGMSSKVRSELVHQGHVQVTELEEEADFKLARMPPLQMFEHYEESWLRCHHNWSPWFGPNIVCPTHVLKEETGGAMERWTAVVVLGQTTDEDRFATPTAVKTEFEKYLPDIVYAFHRLDAKEVPRDYMALESAGVQAEDHLNSFETFCQELASFPKLKTNRPKRCSRLSSGRVALLGDAAHVMSPGLGQGLNSGLEDVASLVEAMTVAQGNVDTALSTYNQRRRSDVDAVIQLSHRGARGRVLVRLENTLAYALRSAAHALSPNLAKSTPWLSDLASADARYKSIYDEQMFFVWMLRVLAIFGSVLGVGAWSAAFALGA